MMNEIRCVDLFGGIGGFRLGLEQASERFKVVWYCEIDKYATQTYNKNFQENWEVQDITNVNTSELPDFDMLCGGFPCQSFSIAGKRKGFKDTRGTLFFEICRIAKEKKPRLLFLENVKGLLSHDEGCTFGTILKSLDELGYDAEWQVLNSKNFGVPQNRERVFIIGHLRTKRFCRSEVFPLRKNDKIFNEAYEESSVVTQALTSTDYKGVSKQRSNVVMCGDFRNDEGLRIRKESVAPTLATRKHSETDISTMPPIIMESLHHHRTGEYGNGKKIEESFTLDSGSGHDLVVHSLQPRSPERPSLQYSSGGSGHLKREDGYSYCLDSGNCQAVETKSMIRRLTPIECERLQGFPDNWTEGVSDTQRYKQLGNAVTVNVIQAIGERILEVIN